MTSQYAPIVLFAYNRPWHLGRTIEALRKNVLAEESDLYIYSDAPATLDASEKVQEVRQYLRQIEGFKSVTIIERDTNFGLARSIIDGVTNIVNKHGRIIVLEDDLVTSRFFLSYMNDALEFYAKDDRVISIHGYCFPISGLPETFFLKGADCWGWGTWKRGWDVFEPDGRKLLEALAQKELLNRLDYFGAYGYVQMLRDQIEGKNSSWAIRWYASALLAGKLTLYPGQSLVSNIGSDGSGTHCGIDSSMDVTVGDKPVGIGGIELSENQYVLGLWANFLKKANRSNWFERINNKLRLILLNYRNPGHKRHS